MIFARRGICSKILKCLKIEKILFRSFFMKIIFRKSWNAPCFHFKNQMRKVWHFEKKHVIDFEMGKGPKINLFDFRAFQDFRAYALTCKNHPSHDFWGISRNPPPYSINLNFSSFSMNSNALRFQFRRTEISVRPVIINRALYFQSKLVEIGGHVTNWNWNSFWMHQKCT